ncbi:MAG: alginate O-acetyltransferase AlgX-related protein [Coriobacteriales bacterium]|jgi:hypothetical protein
MAHKGTHLKKNAAGSAYHGNRGIAVVFIAIALALMLIPSVGMIWFPTESTSGVDEPAAAPSLVDGDGGPNAALLSDAGAYFEDHFAFRNEMITAYARMLAPMGESVTDQVVVGDDGWLFYGLTLPDYLGQSTLSDRALNNIAHNLVFMQGYANSKGADFVFAVAPNKNTLYPEHMPARYVRSDAPGNWERLKPVLYDHGVRYVDLFEKLGEVDEVLYLKTDSHWDNRGALIAANALLAAFERPALAYDEAAWITRDDFTGDIAKMLYPADPGAEEQSYVIGVNDGEGFAGEAWSYVQGSTVEDDVVETRSAGKRSAQDAKRLLVYRDSFANALIPYLSTAFQNSLFTKLVPYDAGQIDAFDADCVVVERAERHLYYLAEHAPIIPAPKVALPFDTGVGDDGDMDATTLERSENGPYEVLSGVLDGRVEGDGVRIFAEVLGADGKTTIYEASLVTVPEDDESGTAASDYGYEVYLPSEVVPVNATIRILAADDGRLLGAKTF